MKFGITSNWKRRFDWYDKKLVGGYIIIKQIEFETRWQAELIEQIVKWRLRKWAVHGTHEWITLPVQPVLDCISQSKKEIEKEYHKHQFIHKRGNERYDYYKQIAAMYFYDNPE